jgi:hypothetical protein
MKRWIILFLVLTTFSSRSIAIVQGSSDLGLWTSINLEGNISPKFSLFFSEEVRLNENISRLNLLFSNGGVEYKINKNIRVALAYRFSEKYTQDAFFSLRHRIQLDITLKKSIDRFDFSYRQRLQFVMKDIYSSETGFLPEWVSRHKFQVKYKLNKYFAPHVAVELRQQIQGPKHPELNSLFYQTDYLAGLDYKLGLRSCIGLYYLFRDGYYRKTFKYLNVIGLEYTYKF